MHIAQNDCKINTGRLPRWKFVENALPYFNMAIDALQNLDRGNRLVERCVCYLSQLTIVPIASCKQSFTFKSLSNQRKLTRTEALNDESTASYVRHHFTQTFDRLQAEIELEKR